MTKLKITKTDSSGQIHDRYTSQQYINGAYVGGTGGNTSQVGRQIQGQTNIVGSSSQQGFIVRQKGMHKFLVQDASAKTGVCTLTNTPSPAAGQMNILVTLNNSTAAIAAANVAGGATSTTVTFSSVTGPVSLPRVGDYLNFGTAPSANIGTFVQVTAMNGSTATIGTVGNVAASSVAAGVCTYASRINNKFVYDFTSDGNLTAGTISSNTYNSNKFRYHLATPDSTFVQVQYA
jgi:hypothetical protein